MLVPQRISRTKLLAPLLLANAVVLALCVALYLGLAIPIKTTNLDTEGRRLEIYRQRVDFDLGGAVSDLRLLASGDGITSYLETGSPADLERAVRRAIFTSKDNPDYDQIRYLDEKGQEVFRLNWNGAVVPKDALQNKADRPYFQKANALGPGQVFVSAIDLNIENGKIEQPIKPTLRLAMPIFDSAGRHRGIYVINYRAGNLIDQLRQLVPRRAQRLRILNPQGYWLAGPSPDVEWGFMLPNRSGDSLAKTDPALWAQVLARPTGQARYQGGWFTWDRIAPKEFAAGKPVTLVTDDDFIVLASVITPEEWAESLASLRETFVVVALLLVILTTFMTRLFQMRRQAQMERDRFFSLTRDMLCIADFNGRFIRVNPAWEETLGYSLEELVSRPFLDFVHPDDRARTIQENQRLLHGGEVVGFENRYRCKDGTYRWLMWSARPLGEAGLIYASARDMTEQNAAAENIRNLNEELKSRADQLEAANKELESFSYSVSHDLRAPLRHIHGFVEMLQKSPALQGEDSAQRQMNVIAKSAREMGRLIDDLLAFSRTGRAEMHVVPFDMRKLVEDCLETLAPETRERRITWKIGPLSPADGDPNLLRLVWANLLGNAVKYTRPRGEAIIEVGQMVSATSPDESGDVTYFVRDNGVGFDMRYANKLFGVFQRLHRAEDFEGTGIGLANVQRIVHRHGGKVWAESKVGGGSTFYFSLPVKRDPSIHAYTNGKN